MKYNTAHSTAPYSKRNGELTVKIKSGFVLEEVGGSYLAVAVGEDSSQFSSLVKLNATGAFLSISVEFNGEAVDPMLFLKISTGEKSIR